MRLTTHTILRLLLLTFVVIIAILVLLNLYFEDFGLGESFWNDLSVFHGRLLTVAQVTAVVLLLLVGWMLVIWAGLLLNYLSSDKDNITVLPFETAPGEDKLNGRAIADAFTSEWLNIARIHSRPIGKVRSESGIAIPREFGVSALNPELANNIATVGAGQTTVSVGQLLVALRRMWPGTKGTTLGGGLQRYDKLVSNTMRVQEGTSVHAWQISREIGSESEISGLVRDLTFKVLQAMTMASERTPDSQYIAGLETAKSVTVAAPIWEAFKYFTDALDAYQRYGLTMSDEELEKARENIVKTAQTQPGYSTIAGLSYALGLEYEVKDDSKALELLRLAARSGTDSKDVPLSEVLALQGWLLIKDGSAYNVSEAKSLLRQAIDSAPKFSFAYFILGFAHDLEENFDEAIEAHGKAIEFYSSEENREYNLGWIGRSQGIVVSANLLYALGNYDEAKRRYQMAIDEADHSEFDPPPLLMSDLLAGSGDFSGALDMCDKAAEDYGNSRHDPESRRQVLARVFVSKASICMMLDDYGEAYRLLQTARDLDPENYVAWQETGVIKDRERLYEDAIDLYEKARDRAPDEALVHTSLASVYRKISRTDGFSNEVARARELLDKGIEDPYNRACLEAVCGNVDKALKALKVAIERKHVHPAWVHRDPDLDFIRNEKGYKDLMRHYRDQIGAPGVEPQPHIGALSKIKDWSRRAKVHAQEIVGHIVGQSC